MPVAAGAAWKGVAPWSKCGATMPGAARRVEVRLGHNAMAMTVGVARVSLYLEETFSLKDKRQVVRSITQKVRNQFNAAIAEVADLNDPRVATLAIVTVSNAAPHAQ